VSGQRHIPAASLPGRTPMSSVQEAGWAPGPVWTGVKDRKSVAVTGVWTPNRPTRSKSFFLFPNFY